MINVAVAALILLSYLACYIHPAWHWISGFMGLLYPVLLSANVLFVLFWVCFRRWYFLVSLGCILLGWGYVQRQVQLPEFLKKKVDTEGLSSLKLMTYNVRSFDVYRYLDTTRTPDIHGKIQRFVSEQHPDVLCIQEFHGDGSRADRLHSMLDLAGIRLDSTERMAIHIYGLVNGSGVVTASKYPIIKGGILEFSNSGNVTIFTDIVKGKDTLRIYNCHLHSFGLKKADTDLLDTIKLGSVEQKTDYLIKIGFRMRDGYIRRAAQVEKIAEHVSQSPYPVVVCGDFNDVPASYTYHTLAKGLIDSFVESGSGFGGTYTLRHFFPVRIDYVLHDSFLGSLTYFSPNLKLSDHEPVVVRLRVIE